MSFSGGIMSASALAIHATSKDAAESIVREGFKVGRSLGDYLGAGAYFYLVSGEGGYKSAINGARLVTERKNIRKPAFVLSRVKIDNALNLQNQDIRNALRKFWEAFTEKQRRFPIHLEKDDDGAYFRPQSHRVIESFRFCIEAISDEKVDILSSRFLTRKGERENSGIPELNPPEICVKRLSAIGSSRICSENELADKVSIDPVDWRCSLKIQQAAVDATKFVKELDDSEFCDLVVNAHQAPADCWPNSKLRFGSKSELGLVYDSSDNPAWSKKAARIEAICHEQNRHVRKLDVATLADKSSVPEALAFRRKQVENVGGLIICLGKGGGETLSVLLNTINSISNPPTLLLREDGTTLPLDAHAHQNVICASTLMDFSHEATEALIRGFVTDNWVSAVYAARIERSIAARHGNPNNRHKDAKQIVKAVAPPRLGLPTPPSAHLANLPFLPEAAADEFLKRLGATPPPINIDRLLAKLGCELRKVPIEGDGYLIRAGVLQQTSVIAIKSTALRSRRRFTIAHELGHLVLIANPMVLEQREDEEEWCDKFAAAVLMPRSEVHDFEQNVREIGDWLKFPVHFQVSLAAANIRLRTCCQLTLVNEKDLTKKAGRLENETIEILALARTMTAKSSGGPKEMQGTLSSGAPYMIRCKGDKFVGVAMLSTRKSVIV